ncbi:hypothetical protein N431DRAFT_327075 [Stipitochalara longipes BDJ]|nr:hypothetical protein N431DRAFT_327075 [Stipitochalara longipes BDJ]
MASRRMRSRGCDQCRRRRVKCDETGDFCRQCLRFGYECSGPVRGVTIIDMTPEAAFPLERAGTPLDRRPKKVRKTSVPVRAASPSGSSKLSANDPTSTPLDGDQPATAIAKRSSSTDKVPMLYQPSTSDAIEMFLVSQFLSFSKPNDAPGLPRSWLTKIPEWMITSQVPAFRLSIRAATTALHARIHHSPAARVEAYRWYVITLNKFRAYLGDQTRKGMIEGNAKFVPGPDEILIPTFLCLFEALSNDSPQGPAVMQHLIAACKILELRGPEGCTDGLFHQMFITYRVSSSLVAIMMGMPSRFSSQAWRTIPFGDNGKTLLHQLVDIIMSVPLYLAQAGHVGPMDRTVMKLAKSDTLPPGLEQNYRRLQGQLESWWEAFETTPPEESEILFTMTESKKYEKVPGVDYSPTLFLQQDSVTAFTVSLYNSTSLIVHTVLHALSIASERLGHTVPPGSSKYHLKQAIIHSNSILEISIQYQEKKPNGMDFMRTMFPLRIVEMLSPPAQSFQANTLIKQFHVANTIPNPMGAGHQNPGPPHLLAMHIASKQNAALQNR